MPEIKNTFLKGKMNKDLDDRLIPEGEYRDAINMQISKSDGSDVGAAHNILGNLSVADLGLELNLKCVGAISDDKRNAIYAFFSGTIDYIYEIIPGEVSSQTTLLCSGTFLNFDANKYITAINILEDQLFWSDGINQPRVIDIVKAKSGEIVYDSEIKIAVAKYSPYKPVIIKAYDTISGNSDYIRERFVRFSYRYKYKDNKYSQIAPFSQIAFQPENDSIQDLDEEKEIYETGIIKNFVNNANRITMDVPLPTDSISVHQIDSIEILMKDSNSAAIRRVTSIDVPVSEPSLVEYVYNSEIPVGTISEDDLLRVNDILPVKAEAQEIVSNRLILGNYTTYAFGAPNFDYESVSVTRGPDSVNKFPNHFLKSRRNYEIGFVFSDIYGRKSPVITASNNTVNIQAQSLVDVDTFRGKKLSVRVKTPVENAYDAATNPLGWYSYRIVVKQLEQDYYNVYLPTLGLYKGKAYITLHGDNVNKVPRNTDNVLAGEKATSNVRLYPKVYNRSTYDGLDLPFEVTDGKISYRSYYVENYNSTLDTTIGGYVSAQIQKFTGRDLQEDQPFTGLHRLYLSQDILFQNFGSSVVSRKPSNVHVFVNGKLLLDNSFGSTTYYYATDTYVGGTYGAVIFEDDNKPALTDKIDVILEFDEIVQQQNTASPNQVEFKSLSNIYRINKTGEASYSDVVISDSSISTNNLVDGESSLQVNDLNPLSEAYFSVYNTKRQSNGSIVDVLSIGEFSTYDDLYNKSGIVQADEVGIYNHNASTLIAELDTIDPSIVGILQVGVGLSVFETEPFYSAIDIYYETQTTGLVSTFSNATESAPIVLNIDYYNSFLIKGQDSGYNNYFVEESRIRGDYNADQVDLGVIAHIEEEDFSINSRPNGLIYSGIYNGKTKVNNTNVFSSAQSITKAVDIQYGGIYKLFAEDTNLNIFQEQRVSSALIDKDAIYTAEGGAITSTKGDVIGQILPYGTTYGIGKNPESFAYNAGRKYFVDPNKNTVLRLSRDGITEISNYGMRSYFRDLLKNYTGNIIGGYDMYSNEYVVNANNVTIGFDEGVKGWTSRYSYMPEQLLSLQSKFYSLKDKNLYQHFHPQATYSTFYGTTEDCSVTLVMNSDVSINKVFNTLNYEGTQGWEVQNITTDTDLAQNISPVTIQGYITDNDLSFEFSKFRLQGGKYCSNLINNSSIRYGEIVSGSDISGLKGFYAKLTVKTGDTDYRELFSISTNYNVNSY